MIMYQMQEKERKYIMDILQRDELFRKREENREKYRELIEKEQKFWVECYKYFLDNKGVISDKEYVDVYEKRLKELNKERQELDSELETLNQELYKLIFPNNQK